MLKICLINPPQIIPQSFGIPTIFQPLGLGYVAALLEKEHEVRIIDANAEGWRNLRKADGKYYSGLTLKEIEARIRGIKPDIVGISVPFSVNELSALSVALTAKSIDKKIITILGGPHPSVRPIETVSHRAVDFVVMGEGEYTALELIQKLENEAYDELENVSGIAYKIDGKPLVTQPRPFIQNLDLIPFPARHLLPMEEYFAAHRARRGPRPTYTFSDRWTSVITSRGCPYRCNFCSIHITMGRKFRSRSPENVIQEVQQIVCGYGIKDINFEDDNMTLDKDRFNVLCDLLVEKGLDITWSTPNGINADTLDEELVSKMKRSGCKRVFVAPESGVQHVVTHIIKKKLDLRKVEEAVVLLKKHGIVVDGSFVIGLIGETKDDIWATIQYALKLRKLGMSKAGFNIATPLYGTELYEEAKQKGYLRKDINSSLLSSHESLIETPEWTTSEISALQTIGWWIVNHTFRQKLLVVLMNLHKFRQYLKIMQYLKKHKGVIRTLFRF